MITDIWYKAMSVLKLKAPERGTCPVKGQRGCHFPRDEPLFVRTGPYPY